MGRLVHRVDPRDGTDAPLVTPSDVGAAVPRAGGGLVLCLRDGLHLQDGDGDPVPWIALPHGPSVRCNDAKADASGRLYAGTMAYDAAPEAGALYRVDPGATRAAVVVPAVTISNGLAWSADGRTLWYIDSPLRRIDAFDVDPASGALSGRRTAVDLSAVAGVPDGMTIDADGGLWVAFFGGACVKRFDPATGACDVTIPIPARDVTSCAFGGPDLADLFVTTARIACDDAELAARPLSGALFRVRPGVRGLPVDRVAA